MEKSPLDQAVFITRTPDKSLPLWLGSGLMAVLLATATGCQSAGKPLTASDVNAAQRSMGSGVMTQAAQASLTPQQALQKLKDGNARFVENKMRARDLNAKVIATAEGQYPLAMILSCIDSRQPIELVFDQGIGDVFSARVAGNVVNADILGSMEFACKVMGSKVITVVGHSNCGAIKGACDGVELGNLTGLLRKIEAAAHTVPPDGQPRTSKNLDFVERVAAANVHLVTQQIRAQSPILTDMLDKGQIMLVGGMYDLNTGKVEFYDSK